MAYINGSKPFHYYNEWDAKTAAWLRELIRRGHLPDGIVDERSITEVTPEDLRGFRQWHFFAGIGGWPLALKLAGWPVDASVCTGSPPCQPFSVAGKRGGRDDSRHLAPAFLDLVAELRPPAIFGEQVSAAIKELWLDALFVELEEEGYTCASAVLPACSVGAPHKRDRLFFGAYRLADSHSNLNGRAQRGSHGTPESATTGNRQDIIIPGQFSGDGSAVRRLADILCDGLEGRLRGWADTERQTVSRQTGCGGAAGDLSHAEHQQRPQSVSGLCGSGLVPGGRDEEAYPPAGRSGDVRMADGDDDRQQSGSRGGWRSGSSGSLDDAGRRGSSCQLPDPADGTGLAGVEGSIVGEFQEGHGEVYACSGFPDQNHGAWSNADWLLCRDGKFRPVESGTFPLANGVPARVVRLRGYGNAIVPQVAAQFIRNFMVGTVDFLENI